MKNYLFTYGSLLLDSSPIKLKALESVFLKGYKLILKKSPTTKNNYHYILLEETGDDNDIVSGYLTEVDEKILIELDKYEGNSYKRVLIDAFDRQLKSIEAFAYISA